MKIFEHTSKAIGVMGEVAKDGKAGSRFGSNGARHAPSLTRQVCAEFKDAVEKLPVATISFAV
ncbi:MAG: hypothetical protein ACLPID_13730 [Beijerinckiaceae bacterium]